MNATVKPDATSVLLPEPATQRQASKVETFLQFLMQSPDAPAARLVASRGKSVEVPRQMYGLLLRIARVLAEGDGISVHGISRELTTTEAATLLGISDMAGKYYFPELGAFLIYFVMVTLLMWRPVGIFGRR